MIKAFYMALSCAVITTYPTVAALWDKIDLAAVFKW